MVAVNATSPREKHDRGDGKLCGLLDSKAASVTLTIFHHYVHRPLLAVLCRSWSQSMPVKSGAIGGQYDADDWSGRMHMGGQVECNFPVARGEAVSRFFNAVGVPGQSGHPCHTTRCIDILLQP
jgi:hypothetical protein